MSYAPENTSITDTLSKLQLLDSMLSVTLSEETANRDQLMLIIETIKSIDIERVLSVGIEDGPITLSLLEKINALLEAKHIECAHQIMSFKKVLHQLIDRGNAGIASSLKMATSFQRVNVG